MLAMLAAATLYAGAVSAGPLAAATTPPASAVDTASSPEHSLFRSRYDVVMRHPSACKAAGRMETAAPVEPALLFRGQDRAAARRLIDLPRAEMCLLGGTDGSGGR